MGVSKWGPEGCDENTWTTAVPSVMRLACVLLCALWVHIAPLLSVNTPAVGTQLYHSLVSGWSQMLQLHVKMPQQNVKMLQLHIKQAKLACRHFEPQVSYLSRLLHELVFIKASVMQHSCLVVLLAC